MIDVLEKKADNSIFDFNTTQPMSNTKLSSGYNKQDVTGQIQVILLLVQNQSFKSKNKTYNYPICGKSMQDWVSDKVKDFSCVKAEIDSNLDFLQIAKANVNDDKKYTLILFSDAPLITSKTIKEIIEYFVIKNLSVLKFTRGYMFETSYLKTIDKLLSPQIQYFEEEDFITCYNPKQYSLICDIMKNRIVSYHQKNGVLFEDVSTVQIDADVSIENDVKIGSNCKILGNSIIESDVYLKQNCLIENSVIKNGSVIENSTVKSSIVGQNCIIKNYCVVQNKSFVGDKTEFCGFNFIDCQIIKRESILKVYEKVEE